MQCFVEYFQSELQAGRDESIVAISRPGEILRAATFDASGNLWMTEYPQSTTLTNSGDGDVAFYSVAAINASANATVPPTRVIPVNGRPQGIAFDPSGNLWVVVSSPTGANAPAIEKFAGAPTSASATPVVSLEGQGTGLSYSGIAFASDGTLWSSVATSFGPTPGALYGFAPSQLASSGAPMPAYSLAGPSNGAAASGQEAIAASVVPVVFDPSGNLWSSDFGVVYEYAASALHASQSAPTRSFQAFAFTNPGGSAVVEIPAAIAFDFNAELYASDPQVGFEVYSVSSYSSSSPSPRTIGATSNNPVPSFISVGPMAPQPIPSATPGAARRLR